MAKQQEYKVMIENGAYCVSFPYDPGAVQALKDRIPATGRSWDGARKCWIIAANCKKQAEIALGMNFPDIAPVVAKKETRLLQVRYLGQCKERAPGDVSAMAMLEGGQWGAIFPVDVLTAWFENAEEIDGNLTLYAVLGAKQDDDEQTIKSAYRRMARQWHPDVCREPDAHTRFLRIREAYDILSDAKKRGRYDAGLKFAGSLEAGAKAKLSAKMSDGIYRAPLRCGWIMAEGVETLGRFVVSKIAQWEDITDGQGRTLVSSWRMGDKSPTELWV